MYIAIGVLALLSVIGSVTLSSRISELHESVNALNEQLLTQNQSIAANVRSVDQNVSALRTAIDKHTVVFLSDDGNLLSKQEYETGDMIVPPTDIPQKSDDEMYTYTFVGWDSDFGFAVTDAVYQAVYSSELREYIITFEDENGNIISSDPYHYGDEVLAPDYYPDEMPDDGKQYEIIWDKDITAVSEDTTYKAVINEVTTDDSSDETDVADTSNSNDTEDTAANEDGIDE